MGTRTPILGLYKPDPSELGWGADVDANFDILDGIGAGGSQFTDAWLTNYVSFDNGNDANSGLSPRLARKTIQSAYNNMRTYAEANFAPVGGRLPVGRIILGPRDHDVGLGLSIDTMRPAEFYGTRSGAADYYAPTASTIMSSSGSCSEFIRAHNASNVGRGPILNNIHFRMDSTINTGLTRIIYTTSCDHLQVMYCSVLNGDGSTRTDAVVFIYQDTLPVGGNNDDSAWFKILYNVGTNMAFYGSDGTNHNRSLMAGNVWFYSGTNPMVHIGGDLQSSSMRDNNFEGAATAVLINPTNSADHNVFENNSGESPNSLNPFYDIVGGSNNCHFIGGHCNCADNSNGIWIRFGTNAWNNTIYGAYDDIGSNGNKQRVVDNSTSGHNPIVHPDWGVPVRTFGVPITDALFNPQRPPNGTLALTAGTPAAVSYVARRGSANAAGPATTLPVTVSGVVIGNFLIVSATCGGGQQLLSVADDGGNTYTLDAVTNDGSVSAAVASCIVAHAVTTITLTFSASTTKMAATVDAFTNLAAAAPFDQKRTGAGTAAFDGTLTTSALPSTTQAAELIVAAFGIRELSSGVFSPGSGYSGLPLVGSDAGSDSLSRSIGLEYQVVSAIGAYTASVTVDPSVTLVYAMATYKVSVGIGLWGRRAGIWKQVD